MKSNFTFLEEYWSLLASLGSMAEKYLYSDSNSCLIKLGSFAESIVHLIFTFDNLQEPQVENTHAHRIKILKKEGLLPKDIDDIFHAIRISRNDAVHAGYESTEQAKILLELAFKLGVWFMQTYGNWSYEPFAFIMPDDASMAADYKTIIDSQEKKIEQLTEKINTVKTHGADVSIADRRKRANSSADKINLSEEETRYLIDEQLRKVGWEANTLNLRYSKGTRPQKNFYS